MATTAPVHAPSTAPLTRSVNGRLRLTYPTRGYAVSRNPFAIWAVLPILTGAFVALAVAEHFGDYNVVVGWFGATSTVSLTVAAFLIVSRRAVDPGRGSQGQPEPHPRRGDLRARQAAPDGGVGPGDGARAPT